jgi:hypothetical protein
MDGKWACLTTIAGSAALALAVIPQTAGQTACQPPTSLDVVITVAHQAGIQTCSPNKRQWARDRAGPLVAPPHAQVCGLSLGDGAVNGVSSAFATAPAGLRMIPTRRVGCSLRDAGESWPSHSSLSSRSMPAASPARTVGTERARLVGSTVKRSTSSSTSPRSRSRRTCSMRAELVESSG